MVEHLIKFSLIGKIISETQKERILTLIECPLLSQKSGNSILYYTYHDTICTILKMRKGRPSYFGSE